MNFHPFHQTLLLVGSANGEITLWEIGMREMLITKSFSILDMLACTLQFQSYIVKDSSVSINRVAWSSDGNLMGIAFTKHLIHVYTYQGPNELRQQLEVC